MTGVQVVVYGQPAPQGSKRFMGRSKSGKGILVESSAAVQPWREAVKAAALDQLVDTDLPLDGPLSVVMSFTVRKPNGAPKKRRTWPAVRPDLSKLVRSTEDALTDAGVWQDDARVVSLVASKSYPNEQPGALNSPGAVINVRVVTE